MPAHDSPGGPVRIRGPRLLLRPFTAPEIDQEWQEMVSADPMAIATRPDEAMFRARLARSGHLRGGWLDLAVEADGEWIGRIQTFVPPNRALPPGTYEIGIGLRARSRGRGYGTEALALLTGWLFSHAGARLVRSETDPANAAMRRVFERCGWQPAGTLTEFGRDWAAYRLTREDWQRQRDGAPDHPAS